jgi:hypothetical protein
LEVGQSDLLIVSYNLPVLSGQQKSLLSVSCLTGSARLARWAQHTFFLAGDKGQENKGVWSASDRRGVAVWESPIWAFSVLIMKLSLSIIPVTVCKFWG